LSSNNDESVVVAASASEFRVNSNNDCSKSVVDVSVACSIVVTIVIIVAKLQPYYWVLLLLSITPTGTKRWTGYGCLLVTMLPSPADAVLPASKIMEEEA